MEYADFLGLDLGKIISGALTGIGFLGAYNLTILSFVIITTILIGGGFFMKKFKGRSDTEQEMSTK